MKYPNNIKSLKKARGWKIDQAAEAMGMSRGGYIKVERGENRLTSTSIANAARAFGVKESEIVSSEEPVAKVARKRASNAASESVAPSVPSPENAASATKDIQLTDIPRTRAQLEKLESQIVREVAELTIRKVYWLLLERRPTDDEEGVLVGFAIEDYEAQKGQRVELAKVAAQTRLEAEDRKADKASVRASNLR